MAGIRMKFISLFVLTGTCLKLHGAYNPFGTTNEGQFTWGRIKRPRTTTEGYIDQGATITKTRDSSVTLITKTETEDYNDLDIITPMPHTEANDDSYEIPTRTHFIPFPKMRKSYQSSFTVNPLANSNMTLVHPLDALYDSSEFHKQPFGKGVDKEDYIDIITLATTTRKSQNEKVNRKPLAEKDLLQRPFVFGCCQNSTYVGCAGVCPETCEYRSKYCMPLCGPPCRCKRGYVYNIDVKACTLRTDCPKDIVQSRNGVYRVFV